MKARANRLPIIHVISREAGEERGWMVGHSDKATCQGILREAVPRNAMIVYTDEYRSYHGLAAETATAGLLDMTYQMRATGAMGMW
jgi:hypothetical protein